MQRLIAVKLPPVEWQRSRRELFGRRFEPWSADCWRRRRRRRIHPAGVRTADQKTSVICITIQPLLALRQMVFPLLGAAFATDKNPNCVFLSD